MLTKQSVLGKSRKAVCIDINELEPSHMKSVDACKASKVWGWVITEEFVVKPFKSAVRKVTTVEHSYQLFQLTFKLFTCIYVDIKE